MTRNPDQQTRQGRSPAPVPAKVKRTRLGGMWIVLVLGAAVLVLLLVFILMNSNRVDINFFGAHVATPLGVGLLLAAALGVLLVVIPGGGRIIQLKRAARRLHKEREHLAGRLDEVHGATDPAAEEPAVPAAGPSAGQDSGASGTAPERQPSGGRRFLPGRR
jgi:uncharacterized integral membrane protein